MRFYNKLFFTLFYKSQCKSVDFLGKMDVRPKLTPFWDVILQEKIFYSNIFYFTNSFAKIYIPPLPGVEVSPGEVSPAKVNTAQASRAQLSPAEGSPAQ